MSLTKADEPTSKVPADEVPWAQIWEGIELKLLRVGGKSGTYTVMSRFAPGTVLPKHRHFGEVHAYTLKGRWRYKEYDWEATAGDYIYEEPNSIHTLEVPADASEPAEIVFIIEKGMVMLGDNDEMFMIEDAATVAGYYRQALEAQGVEYPSSILP